MEVFLRGLSDKEAARSASDKCPKTINKALKYVKNAVNTQRAIFGKSSTVCQVSFAELEMSDVLAWAASPDLKQKDAKSLDTAHIEQLAKLKWLVNSMKGELQKHSSPESTPQQPSTVSSTLGSPQQSSKQSTGSPAQNSSPSGSLKDRVKCFKCGGLGHFAQNCSTKLPN